MDCLHFTLLYLPLSQHSHYKHSKWVHQQKLFTSKVLLAARKQFELLKVCTKLLHWASVMKSWSACAFREQVSIFQRLLVLCKYRNLQFDSIVGMVFCLCRFGDLYLCGWTIWCSLSLPCTVEPIYIEALKYRHLILIDVLLRY